MTTQKPIFEIEGVPRKKNLFKKHRSYIAAFPDQLYIELDGEKDTIMLKDIFDIYIQETFTEDIDCRTTVVKYFEEGEENWYELEDDTFNGLAAKVEMLLANHWTHFLEMRNQPPTVKWIAACNALVYASSGVNYHIFGGMVKTPEEIVNHKKVLYDSWRINSRNDLLNMLPKLLNGRAVEQYNEELGQAYLTKDEERRELLLKIKKTCGDKSIWAWDLCRLTLLCSFGYICDYLSWNEAMQWGVEAGEKLQSIYSSWDEMVGSYLLGYCFWANEDLDDEDSEAYKRANIYNELKKMKDNPFSIAWNYPLSYEEACKQIS